MQQFEWVHAAWLGLAIVHEILTHLGETIEARNEGENAVFRFTIGI